MDHSAHGPGHGPDMALAATLHCLTGCALGEVGGLLIATGTGLGAFGTAVVSIGLAFVFGYSLSSLPLLAAGLPLATVAGVVLAADTLSIAVMEVVDTATVTVYPGAMDAGTGDAVFWLSTLIALCLAFVAAFPLNRWLLSRGRGHAVSHGATAGVDAAARRQWVPVPPTGALATGIVTFLLGGLLVAATS